MIAGWTFYQLKMMTCAEDSLTRSKKVPGEIAKIIGPQLKAMRLKKAEKHLRRLR